MQSSSKEVLYIHKDSIKRLIIQIIENENHINNSRRFHMIHEYEYKTYSC